MRICNVRTTSIQISHTLVSKHLVTLFGLVQITRTQIILPTETSVGSIIHGYIVK